MAGRTVRRTRPCSSRALRIIRRMVGGWNSSTSLPTPAPTSMRLCTSSPTASASMPFRWRRLPGARWSRFQRPGSRFIPSGRTILPQSCRIKLAGGIVLLNTGWGARRARSEEWLHTPHFCHPPVRNGCKPQGKGNRYRPLLHRRKPRPDKHRTHEIVLGAGVWVVEDLCFREGWREASEDAVFQALPLHMQVCRGPRVAPFSFAILSFVWLRQFRDPSPSTLAFLRGSVGTPEVGSKRCQTLGQGTSQIPGRPVSDTTGELTIETDPSAASPPNN